MKKTIQMLEIIGIFLIMTGCFYNDNLKIEKNELESESNNMSLITKINITIDNKQYIATLENNETAQAFANNLPQSFNMNELNGNEKYVYMDNSLPTNESNPKHIVAGDIMLYGSDCLVIFYKSFDTSYSYTPIGHIDNLPELGNGNITVKFEKP